MAQQHRERVKRQWIDRDRGSAPEHTGKATLAMFVYGTLRPGGGNHDRFCRGFVWVEPASVPGVLEWLTPQIPILHVPSSLMLAVGTDDPAADVATQAHWATLFASEGQPYPDGPNEATRGHVRVVEGEVLTFDDPETRLPAIDRLEGFLPGGDSLYRRVLVRVSTEDGSLIPAWIYASPS